jgi:malate/lactate dehydrogenase
VPAQASPSSDAAGLPHEVIDALTKRTQDGGTEVVQAKAGKVMLPPVVAMQCGSLSEAS